jgi:2'-5' RNA ligase
MLLQHPTTIPAEIRDYPEWHHGRENYAVWILQLEDDTIRKKFKAARQHLSGYLLKPYLRQPHITLFVCGFLVGEPKRNDDFTQAQLDAQTRELQHSQIQSFEIEIGGLNSFASAPFLEVHDPEGEIDRLRKILSNGAREFRTTDYMPHLTVGLYADMFPSEEALTLMRTFSSKPVRIKVEEITLATYRAREIAGRLKYLLTIRLDGNVSQHHHC